jgi:Fe-S cluster assembly scaffold protein SufB
VTANIVLPHSGASRTSVEQLSRSRREPDWLLDVRLRALDAFERLPLPDQRTETWRRTSLRGLDLSSVDAISSPPSVAGRGAVRFEDALSDPRLEPIIRRHFSQVVGLDADKFVALHYALFNAAAVVYVPRGKVVEEPVEVGYSGTGAVLAHTLVVLEDEADLAAIVENLSGGAPIASGVLEQVVGTNAHTRHVQLQRFSRETWNFSTQRTHLAQDASVRTLNVALGSRMSRNTVQVVLNGRGSQADLLGVVDVAARQHVDF